MFNEENLWHFSLDMQIDIVTGALADPSPWYGRDQAQEYLDYLHSVKSRWYANVA